MPSDLLRKAYRWALILCVLGVSLLAFAPLTHSPLFSYDKSNHLFAFAVLAWLVERNWPSRPAAVRWGLLLGYGLLIELVQSQLPYRDFSLLDLVADGVGILCYLTASALLLRLASLVRLLARSPGATVTGSGPASGDPGVPDPLAAPARH